MNGVTGLVLTSGTDIVRGDVALADPSAGDPRRDIRVGLVLGSVFLALLFGWGMFAKLDAATHVSGYLAVSGQNQVIQHRDGGVLGQVAVKDGQSVHRGQLLVSLASPEVEAQERALAGTVTRLLALRARLRAEQNGGRIATPPEFAELELVDAETGARELAAQESERAARRSALAAQMEVMTQRGAQAGSRGADNLSGLRSSEEQLRLIDAQLAQLKPLADSGFVSQNRLRELQRTRAALEGDRGHYAALIGASQGESRESSAQRLSARENFRQQVAAELREAEFQLGEALPKLAAAREQLARTRLRAPVDGTVSSLVVFASGTVVSPGMKLMEIVPAKRNLVVEGRVEPQDAGDIRPGQEAEVRLAGVPDIAGIELRGTVTRVSADRLIDQTTGASYFSAEIAVPEKEFARLTSVGRSTMQLRPGQPVDVLVLLRERSALSYIFEPLTRHFWGSLREK